MQSSRNMVQIVQEAELDIKYKKQGSDIKYKISGFSYIFLPIGLLYW